MTTLKTMGGNLPSSIGDQHTSTTHENSTSQPLDDTTTDLYDAEKAAVLDASTWGNTDVPDGGLAAWLVVFGAWTTSFCSFGWLNSVGTFQEYYERTLLRNYSASQISWIPSLQIFFMFAMGPIVGKLYDSHGPRYLLLVGSFLHVFGLMMASISTEYYQLMLSQGICSAIGVACIFQSSISSVSGWFSKKRGMAYGILATGSSMGGVIFPIMVSRLITEINYGWSMRISAFLILALLIIANLTIKARLPPHPNPPTKEELVEPFKEVGTMAVIGGNFFLVFAIFIPITYIIVEAQAQGMPYSLSQYLLAMLNGASLFGRLFSGIMADKVGRFNIFVSVCYMTGILILALWIPASSNAATIVFTCLFGFFSGAYVSLGPALIAQLSPPKVIGYRTGLMFLISSIGGLVTNPIAGAILARENGNFLGMKIFAGVFCLAGTTIVALGRLHITRWKLLAKM